MKKMFGIDFKGNEKSTMGFSENLGDDQQRLYASKETVSVEVDGKELKLRACVYADAYAQYESGEPYSGMDYSVQLIYVPDIVSLPESFRKEQERTAGVSELTEYDLVMCGVCAVVDNAESTTADLVDTIERAKYAIEQRSIFVGFDLDKPRNRIGTDGWDLVRHWFLGGPLLVMK